MTDPIGLDGWQPLVPSSPAGLSATARAGGTDFIEMLEQQMKAIDGLQQDVEGVTAAPRAREAMEVDDVMLAARKADLAFQMLMQVRNAVVEAYDGLARIRV